MRKALLLTGVLLVCQAAGEAQEKTPVDNKSLYDFQVTSIDGKKVDLAKYKGKVLLIVNVASECGYTPQYKGLQALHAKYGKDGLAVLGFPCNDFGAQEPDDEAKIKAFCSSNYGVTFDMFSKIAIAGKNPAPLYKYLISKKTNPKHAGAVKWNFEKFIVSREGTVVARFPSDVEPDSDAVVSVLRRELDKK
jgi:glutathione peroxidase